MAAEDARSFRYSRAMRLSQQRDFRATFDARISHGAGPIVIYAKPNDRDCFRLGLVVNRRVGAAVRRNRIKRLLREAFRLARPTFTGAYDLVIVVRPHEPRTLAEYQRLIDSAVRTLHERWRKRNNMTPKIDRDPDSPPAS